MQHGSKRKTRTRPTGHAACDCCGLLTPRAELLPWARQVRGKELAIQDPDLRPGRRPEDEVVRGVYRHFRVTQQFQVCDACFDHLLDGGEFAPAFRHRTTLGLIILAAVVVALVVFLPQILPLLSSALWLEKAEN